MFFSMVATSLINAVTTAFCSLPHLTVSSAAVSIWRTNKPNGLATSRTSIITFRSAPSSMCLLRSWVQRFRRLCAAIKLADCVAATTPTAKDHSERRALMVAGNVPTRGVLFYSKYLHATE
jgi:hypothetical protein